LRLKTTQDIALALSHTTPRTVPYPTGFRIIDKTTSGSDSIYTLRWWNPEKYNIAGFNVYSHNFDTNTVKLVGTGRWSPMRVTIPTAEVTMTVFRIQTILNGGQTNDLLLGPTISPA
jgi:hypothetical protein